MLDCWKEEPDERPSFEQLIPKLEKMMTKDNPYFDWDGDNESDASETKPESDQLNEWLVFSWLTFQEEDESSLILK